ncbi:hypothetical protein ACWCY6_41065 [Streptomyces sp. 900105755]
MRERVGDRAELRIHDVEKPLDFIDDALFDEVACALMLHQAPCFLAVRLLRP